MPTRALPLAPSRPMVLAREVGRMAIVLLVAVAVGLLEVGTVSANEPPTIGVDEYGFISEGECFTRSPLSNDTDQDGDALSLTGVSQGSSLTVTSSGAQVEYCLGTAAIAADTTDSFTYTVSDGTDTAVGTITLQLVNAPNSPPIALDYDLGSVTEGQCATVQVIGENPDRDGDAVTLRASAVTTGIGYTAMGANPGEVTYCVNPRSTDTDVASTFVYYLTDGTDESTGTVTAYVVAVAENGFPTPAEDFAEVEEGGCVDIDVLANDTDPENDPLTVSIYLDLYPEVGTAELLPDQTFRYCADPSSAIGTVVVFTYQADDGISTAQAADVFVTVVEPTNTAPVAVDDSLTIDEGTCLYIPVLDNDSDVDGDVLTVAASFDDARGQGEAWADGTVRYCTFSDMGPADVEIVFTYTVSDGVNEAVEATVTVTVRHVNDPPVAVDDVATTTPGTCVRIDVLANDSDPNGDAFRISGPILTSPRDNHTLDYRDAAAGFITYCPKAGFTGDDGFGYRIRDWKAADSAVVRVTVAETNTAPVAEDDSWTVPRSATWRDQPQGWSAGVGFEIDLVANDDDADGDTLSLTPQSISFPANFPGSVSLLNDGRISYVGDGDPGFSGTTSFTYRAWDGTAYSQPATVTLDIQASPEVTVPPDDRTLAAGTPAELDLGSFLDDDGSGPWTVRVYWDSDNSSAFESFTVTEQGDLGTRSHTFPSAGSYRLAVGVTDEDGLGAFGESSITVGPPLPVAEPDSIQVPQGARIIFRVTDNDSNPGNGALRIVDVTQPATLGSVSIEEYAYRLDYRAPMDAFGTDQVTYTVEDSNGNTGTGVVTIEVVEGLACVDDAVTVLSNRSIDIDVLANDPGLDGDTSPSISEDLAGLVGSLTAVDNTPQSPRRYTPPQGFVGTEVYTYENRVIKDGYNLICGATVTLTVVNAPPVAGTDTLVLSQGSYGYVDAFANDEDPNGDELRMTDSFGGAEHGGVFFEGAFVPGRYYYQAFEQDYVGEDSFTYIVADGRGGYDTGTVEVEILAGAECFADAATTTKGDAVTILALANDNDREGDPFTIVDVSAPEHGTATIAGTTDAIVYTPEAGFVGTDTFTYTKTDGSNVSCRAEVTVEVVDVVPVVTAPADQTAVEGKVKRFVFGSFADPSGAGAGPWDVTVDWGDGSIPNESSLTSTGFLGSALHAFPADGDVTVTVTVENAAGLTGSATFTVVVSNAAPTLAAGYNQTVTQGRSTSIRVGYFVDPGSAAPWTVTVDWGDATPPQSFPVSATGNINALHTYASEGSYPVAVVVTDGDGASSPSRSFTVTVANAAPTLVATYDQQVAEGRSTTIGLGYFVDPGSAAPWTVTVDWGDGTVEAPAIESFSVAAPGTIRAAHSYAAVGSFAATVSVTDGQGATSVTRVFTVTSVNAPPTLAAGFNRTVTRGVATTIALGYFSDPASGAPWTVTVDWGDGSAGAPAVETFTVDAAGTIRSIHTYATAGSYPVTVFVSDSYGARSVSRSFTVTAANAAPTLAVGANQTVRRGTPASINLGYFVDPGSVAPWTVTVVWGDGSTPAESVQVSATGTIRLPHTYATPGTYTVTVYVVDGEGARSASRSLTVTVT